MSQRERSKITDWLQAGAALLAVVVAAPALWIAVETYRDQLRVTEAQLRSTDAQLESARLERERYEQRYATRVTFWNDSFGDMTSPEVTVQNRSPVPITRVSFVVAHESGPVFQKWPKFEYEAMVDVPPCSILTFRLDIWENQKRKQEGGTLLGMRFLDPVRWWTLSARPSEETDPYGPPAGFRAAQPFDPTTKAIEAKPPKELSLVAQEVGKRQPATDCGESD